MWLVVDLLLVAVFAAIGRLSHDESLTVAGWWTTAWPFLLGTLLGWAALVATRRPPAAVTSGLVVWAGALVGGMALRQASGQGTATPFVVVATVVLGALLVLPRVVLTRFGPTVGSKLSSRDGSGVGARDGR